MCVCVCVYVCVFVRVPRCVCVTHDTVQNSFLRPGDTGQEIGISEYAGDLLARSHTGPYPHTPPNCSSRLLPQVGMV